MITCLVYVLSLLVFIVETHTINLYHFIFMFRALICKETYKTWKSNSLVKCAHEGTSDTCHVTLQNELSLLLKDVS